MKNPKRIVSGIVLGGLLVVGCAKEKGAEPTKPAAVTPTVIAPALKVTDLTHVVTKDAVLYKSAATGAAPVGSVKAGTKVLVLIPGSDSSQVELLDGTMGYVSTEALDVIPVPAPPPPPKVVVPAKVPVAPPTPVVPVEPKVAPKPVVVTPPPPLPKETHVLSKEQPYFAAMPTADAKPAGMLPAGTKVLLVIPGSDYAQVETLDGKTVFTPTEGLDSIAK